MLLVADFLLSPPLDRAAAVSPLVVDRDGLWIRAFTNGQGRWRLHADLDAIDPTFVRRLIIVEDKRFWSHWGVDPAAILRASASAASAGRFTSGASTITMQVARLLEPRPRTIPSKFIEMLRAIQIEERLSKKEILELYLTLAPYGGNIEGVRAASLLYFGKEPARLTDGEQALLIALPQAPEARRPDLHPDTARVARNEILQKFADAGLISSDRLAEAQDAPLQKARSAMPNVAYQAAYELVSAKGSPSVVHSTLDLRLQRGAESLVADYAAKLTDGATAALMIIDNRTHGVRAAVASASRDDQGGWMDLTRAVRSPGSTLKPFIYGMAFEDGLVGPDTVIEDMPQSFNGYAPEDFDRTYRGEVRVADALQHSLNIPAVRLLNALGAGKLAALLAAAGVKVEGPKRADGDHFGLTLALGGAGVTMRDLAMLYSGLADGGAVKQLAWTTDQEAKEAKEEPRLQLFSAESARRISDILAGAPALEGRMPADLSKAAPRVAYKTGTSYGFRDAWSVGSAGRYTVVVWVGRADGAPRPDQTGRKAAAPLLMDIFDMLARLDPDGVSDGRSPAETSGPAIARLAPPRRLTAPEIVFPRSGVELYASSGNGFALAARRGAGDYRWYANGDPVAFDVGGRAIWRPAAPGFYDIVVVDKD
ncbi:MAG TPA: penicillin-binding protein 1C, partial [Parvularculaceae bacterium]|nr:penicillin-binding protein 1C [Parvularculaceae bacterium]